MSPTLLERFTDDDPKVRLAALLEAGNLESLEGKGAVVEGMIRRLHDDHPGIRQASIDMLGKLTTSVGLKVDERVVKRVIELTRDPTEGVRAEASSALALLGDTLEVPGRTQALIVGLQDESTRVKEGALAALGDLGVTDATDAMAELLSDRNAKVRFEAAFALASLKDARGLEVLCAALPKPKLRLDACEALRRLADPTAKPALNKLLDRWLLPWVDKLAVQATLHAMGEASGGDYVVSRTKARNLRERTYALSLVGSHGITQGRPALEAAAQDAKDILQGTAIRALGELGDAQAKTFLRELKRTLASDAEVVADIDEQLAVISSKQAKTAR